MAAKNAKSTKAAKVASKPQTSGKAAKISKVAPKAAKAQNGPGAAYREGSSYGLIVSALLKTPGKMVGLDSLVATVKKGMGAEGWKAFASKKGATSPEDRVKTNAAVVARKDYGEPLRASGWEVRFDGREKTAGIFKL